MKRAGLWAGVVLSLIYLLGIYFVRKDVLDFLAKGSLVEIGGFLGGAAAPLGVFWLALGYFFKAPASQSEESDQILKKLSRGVIAIRPHPLIVVALVGVFALVLFLRSAPPPPPSIQTDTVVRSAAQLPVWQAHSTTDEMSGETSWFATSPQTSAKVRMSFPYRNTRSWMGFECNGSSERVYIGFTHRPNLTTDKRRDGYKAFNPRIRWDKDLVRMNLIQERGAQFLFFQSGAEAIRRMTTNVSVLLELPWYREGPVRFPYSLIGSPAAIQKARRKCAALGDEGIRGVQP